MFCAVLPSCPSRQRQDLRLRHVQSFVPAQASLPKAFGDAHRRTTVPVQGVRQGLFAGLLSQSSRENAHRRETASVRHMHESLLANLLSESAHENAQRRTTVPVQHLPEVVCAQLQPAQAHAHPRIGVGQLRTRRPRHIGCLGTGANTRRQRVRRRIVSGGHVVVSITCGTLKCHTHTHHNQQPLDIWKILIVVWGFLFPPLISIWRSWFDHNFYVVFLTVASYSL